MVEQLSSSMDWDCKSDYYEKRLLEKKKTPKQWLKDSIKNAQDSLDYARTHLKEEHESTLKTIEWITQLQSSVPLPKKNKK